MNVSGRERSRAAVDPAHGFNYAQAVGFEAYFEDADLAPFLKGFRMTSASASTWAM